jgi:hypothetical protein
LAAEAVNTCAKRMELAVVQPEDFQMPLDFRKEFGTSVPLSPLFHSDDCAAAIGNQARLWSLVKRLPALGHDANLHQKVTSRGGAVDSAIVPYSAAAQPVTLGSNKC